jgi:hypothetical protein
MKLAVLHPPYAFAYFARKRAQRGSRRADSKRFITLIASELFIIIFEPNLAAVLRGHRVPSLT